MADYAWVGQAPKVPQVDSIDLAGTWAASETISIDLESGPTLTLTTGSGDIDTIGADLVVMLTGSGTLSSAASTNSTGDKVPLFTQLSSVTWDNATDKLTVTGKADGRPFTMNVSETSASGTATHNAEDTAASGPHAFDVAENWAGGSVPVTGSHNVIFDERAQNSLLYKLSQSSIAPAKVEVTAEFLAKGLSIGNPPINTDTAQSPYYEPLDEDLAIGSNTTALTVNIGRGSGEPASSFCNFDFGTAVVTGTIRKSHKRPSAQIAPLRIKGTGGGSYTFYRGEAEFANRFGESSTVGTINVYFTTIATKATDVKLTLGESVTISGYNQLGGTVVSHSNLAASCNIEGGLLQVLDGGTVTGLTIQDGGVVDYRADGTITTVTVYRDGLIDFSQDRTSASRGITNCELYAGASYRDPYDTVTLNNGLDLHGCRPTDLKELTIGVNKRLTLGTIS